jgi:uracil-DNA glycosylase
MIAARFVVECSAMTIIPANAAACTRCPRLQRQFSKLRDSHPDYWNRPVPASGCQSSRLLIVGLAPGKHGANKTGVPFTGDSSGVLLFKVLSRLGIERQVRITNAVKCLPVKNKPSRIELQNCSRFLASEISEHTDKKAYVVLALGHLAHKSILGCLNLRQSQFPFSHGAVHAISQTGELVDSYHCSRYNTQTGRLTEEMFYAAVARAAHLSCLKAADRATGL